MTALLDGRELTSCAAFHTRIAAQLHFPAYYGKNLDALYDCLTSLPAGSSLTFLHFADFRAHVGERYAARVLRVLKDAAREGAWELVCEE